MRWRICYQNLILLRKATSAFIKSGLNQVNTLAVIARGSSIYLYINQQYITGVSDSTYQAGEIGVFGGNFTDAPADVVFSHVQVWNV
jgi:eukaryotic-like serine/threonine-protein kinase